MTREEAIELIESARKTMYLPKSKEYISDFGYALEMAIKALEQSNYNSIKSELNGDMISRQAVCKIIDDIRDCISVEGYWAFLERLKKLPPVTPQSKSGEWIVHEKPHGIRYLECPYCNIWYLNEHLIRNSFCPNCGARMIES